MHYPIQLGSSSSQPPNSPNSQGKGVAKTITKQRVESHFDLELRAAVMSLGRSDGDTMVRCAVRSAGWGKKSRRKREFHGNSMGISWEFMGFYGDFMGFTSIEWPLRLVEAQRWSHKFQRRSFQGTTSLIWCLRVCEPTRPGCRGR